MLYKTTKIKYVSTLALLLALNAATFTNPISAAQTKVLETKTEQLQIEKTNLLNARLIEINAIDKSLMTRQQKHEKRKEVKEIQKQLKQISGGVYVSTGAIILIIILLIILL